MTKKDGKARAATFSSKLVLVFLSFYTFCLPFLSQGLPPQKQALEFNNNANRSDQRDPFSSSML